MNLHICKILQQLIQRTKHMNNVDSEQITLDKSLVFAQDQPLSNKELQECIIKILGKDKCKVIFDYTLEVEHPNTLKFVVYKNNEVIGQETVYSIGGGYIKIKGQVETAINANGPNINDYSIALLLKQIDDLDSNDIVVLAGYLPSTIDSSIYALICKKLYDKRQSAAEADAKRQIQRAMKERY